MAKSQDDSDITIKGEIDIVEVVSSLRHVVAEMERIGNYIGDIVKENEKFHQKMTDRLHAIDKRVVAISATVAVVTTFLGWLIQRGG